MSKNARQVKLRRETTTLGGALLLGLVVLLYAVRVGDRKREAAIAASATTALERQKSLQAEQKYQEFDKDVLFWTPAGAINCGVSYQRSFDNDTSKINDCIVAAFIAHKPFQASCIHNEMTWGSQEKLIGTAKGSLYLLYRAEHGSEAPPSYEARFCKRAVVTRVKGRRRLARPRWIQIK